MEIIKCVNCRDGQIIMTKRQGRSIIFCGLCGSEYYKHNEELVLNEQRKYVPIKHEIMKAQMTKIAKTIVEGGVLK